MAHSFIQQFSSFFFGSLSKNTDSDEHPKAHHQFFSTSCMMFPTVSYFYWPHQMKLLGRFSKYTKVTGELRVEEWMKTQSEKKVFFCVFGSLAEAQQTASGKSLVIFVGRRNGLKRKIYVWNVNLCRRRRTKRSLKMKIKMFFKNSFSLSLRASFFQILDIGCATCCDSQD